MAANAMRGMAEMMAAVALLDVALMNVALSAPKHITYALAPSRHEAWLGVHGMLDRLDHAAMALTLQRLPA